MTTDQENTWRALQGLKPIQSLTCRLGWHRWSSYEYLNSDMSIGRFYDYARCHCVDCGMPRIEYPHSKTVYKKKSKDQ